MDAICKEHQARALTKNEKPSVLAQLKKFKAVSYTHLDVYKRQENGLFLLMKMPFLLISPKIVPKIQLIKKGGCFEYHAVIAEDVYKRQTDGGGGQVQLLRGAGKAALVRNGGKNMAG